MVEGAQNLRPGSVVAEAQREPTEGRQGAKGAKGKKARDELLRSLHPPAVMTVLLSASAVVAGVFAYGDIPIAALPQFDTPTIQVTAVLPGASPENMASSVATPLEKQFATISDVDVISSSSTPGQTQITLEFDAGPRHRQGGGGRAGGAASRASRSLPIEMTTPPSYRKVNPADAPIIFVTLTSPSMALSELNALRRQPDRADALDAPRRGADRGERAEALRGARARAPRRARRAQPHDGRHRQRR